MLDVDEGDTLAGTGTGACVDEDEVEAYHVARINRENNRGDIR